LYNKNARLNRRAKIKAIFSLFNRSQEELQISAWLLLFYDNFYHQFSGIFYNIKDKIARKILQKKF